MITTLFGISYHWCDVNKKLIITIKHTNITSHIRLHHYNNNTYMTFPNKINDYNQSPTPSYILVNC